MKRFLFILVYFLPSWKKCVTGNSFTKALHWEVQWIKAGQGRKNLTQSSPLQLRAKHIVFKINNGIFFLPKVQFPWNGLQLRDATQPRQESIAVHWTAHT